MLNCNLSVKRIFKKHLLDLAVKKLNPVEIIVNYFSVFIFNIIHLHTFEISFLLRFSNQNFVCLSHFYKHAACPADVKFLAQIITKVTTV